MCQIVLPDLSEQAERHEQTFQGRAPAGENICRKPFFHQVSLQRFDLSGNTSDTGFEVTNKENSFHIHDIALSVPDKPLLDFRSCLQESATKFEQPYRRFIKKSGLSWLLFPIDFRQLGFCVFTVLI